MLISSHDARSRVQAAAELELRKRRAALLALYTTLVVVFSREDVEKLDPETRQYRAVSPQQEEAYQSTRINLRTLFGGAKGGAKSVGGVRNAQRDIASSRGGIHLVTRQNYTDLLRTTKQTYERFFPPELVIEKTELRWRCINGWEIWFYAADISRDPRWEKLGGLEVTTIHNDEVSQQPESFYEAIPATLRREAYHLETGAPMPHYVYDTTNPVVGPHFTKKYFIDPKTRRGEDYVNELGDRIGHRFIQSLPDSNPLLEPTYIKQAFGSMTGAMLRMMRYGQWDVDQSEFVIIPSAVLHAISIEEITDRDPVGAGIDIGLGRPDLTTVWLVNRAGQMWREASLAIYDTDEQVEILTPIVARVNRNRGKVYVDASNIGLAVAKPLRRKFGATVVLVQFGDGPVPEKTGERKPVGRRYVSRRAQLYAWAREDAMAAAKAIERGQTALMLIQLVDELVEELAATFFVPYDGPFKLILKEEIIQRIGRSPDDGDGLVLCNAARRATASVSRAAGRPAPAAPASSLTPVPTAPSRSRPSTKNTLRGYRL